MEQAVFFSWLRRHIWGEIYDIDNIYYIALRNSAGMTVSIGEFIDTVEI